MKVLNRIGKAVAASLLGGTLLMQAMPASVAQDADAVKSPFEAIPGARTAQKEKGRIVGGSSAEAGKYPFQVAILVSGMLNDSADSQVDSLFCGGSLISPNWVLTAAHCLNLAGAPIDPEMITVLTGATDLAEGTRHAVAEIISHPDYDETITDNDLGLIRLATPATQPVIKITDTDVDNGDAVVTGWGRMRTGLFPRNLMEAQIRVVPNAACNQGLKEIYAADIGNVMYRYSWKFRIPEDKLPEIGKAFIPFMGDKLTANMMCAGVADGARDACQGDSGGPLFMMKGGKPIQVGVVSWGEGPMNADIPCGAEKAYGVYTRISRYKDWIREKTGIR